MQAGQSEAETHGLSLEELQRIATEVGLDPNVVAAAAAELERGGIEEASSGFLGASRSMYIERVLPGEISEYQLHDVAAKIGESFDMVGTSGQVGRSLEWTHNSRRVDLQVTVTPRDGQTKVRIVGKWSRVALSFFIPSLIIGSFWGTIIPLGMELSPAIAFSIGAVMTIAAYLFSRFGFSAYVRKKERSAEKLMREIDGLIGNQTEAVSEAKSEARIELPEEEGSERSEDAEPSRIRQTRSQT